jgi:quercetin 2,3-dioxygenase
MTSHDAGALLRVIAGDVAGHQGPGSTYTPMAMVHATLAATARLELPWDTDFNALVYVLSGAGSIGAERHPIHGGQIAVLGGGDVISVAADQTQSSTSPTLELIILGGQPIREPVAWGGPFVMNTRAEVLAAFEDFQRGAMGQIPAVHGLDNSVTESS